MLTISGVWVSCDSLCKRVAFKMVFLTGIELA